MKIGILTTTFPRWQDDYMGCFILEAARAIHRCGHQVKVVSIHSPGAKASENWEGIEILRTRYLPEKWELLKSQGGGLPEVWKNKPLARIQVLPFIVLYLIKSFWNTLDCDIIHANWTISAAVAWAILLITGKPYVVTVQGSDIFKAARMPLISFITRIVLKRAKKVLALSKSLADEVQGLGIDKSHVEIIPNGVDTNRFNPLPYDNRANQILFVGSLIERKGVRYLIRAFVGVVQKYPQMRLVLVGEGAQREEYEALASSLSLSNNVIFTGSQNQDEVAHWMQNSKLFVLPSIEEGLGVVLLEALSSGTPIVASQVGGIADVVDEAVGRLVPATDEAALQRAIEFFLDLSKDDWNTFNAQARATAVSIYDWDVIAQHITDIYKK